MDDNKKIDPKKKKQKSFKEFDPTKYIDTEPTMNEAVKGVAVVSFGRFNPITTGHEKLVNAVMSEAIKRKGEPAIYMSHTQDPKKNPLSYDQKVSLGQSAFGKVVKKSTAKTLIEVAKELSGKYSELVVVVGSDRVNEFETLMNKYNGKEYNFENISVVSAGERDPDSDDVSGMSASKMRSLAAKNDLEAFKNGLPKKLKSSAKKVYDMVRNGMNMTESTEEVVSEAAPLTLAQRRKRGLIMKRYKTKIKAARERAKRKMAPKENLLKRARKRALEVIRDRLMKNKKYSEMSPAEKINLDARLAKVPKAVIGRIAAKLLPKVRAAEKERLQSVLAPKQESLDTAFETFLESRTVKPQDKDVAHMPGSQPKGYYAGVKSSVKDDRARHFAKYSKKSDDEQSSYKPAPGDKGAKTKTSVHTTKFKQMFGESLNEASQADTKFRKRPHMALEKNGSVKFDKRFKIFKKQINESHEDFSFEILGLMEDVDNFVMAEEYDILMENNPEEALKNKAEKSGISYGILKKVFDRGVAAWRTGHRPGTTPTQWGLARVNSFATKGKGTWGKADSDLAAKVRSEAVSPTAVHPFVHVKDPDKAVKIPKALKHKLGVGLTPKHVMMHGSKAIDLDVDGDVDKFDKTTPDEITGTEKKNVTRQMQKKYSGEVKTGKIGNAFESVDEGVEQSKAKVKISQEKMADARKHDRMLDAAKQRDKSSRKNLSRDIQEGDPNPHNREDGTDKLVKTYKKDTPGEKSLKEFMLAGSFGTFKRGDRVRFTKHSMDMFDGQLRKGTVVGGDVSWLRVRDDDGTLYKVRHYNAAAVNNDDPANKF
jgi:nicotinic acid mononucleotide adenylyltransferase